MDYDISFAQIQGISLPPPFLSYLAYSPCNTSNIKLHFGIKMLFQQELIIAVHHLPGEHLGAFVSMLLVMLHAGNASHALLQSVLLGYVLLSH